MKSLILKKLLFYEFHFHLCEVMSDQLIGIVIEVIFTFKTICYLDKFRSFNNFCDIEKSLVITIEELWFVGLEKRR